MFASIYVFCGSCFRKKIYILHLWKANIFSFFGQNVIFSTGWPSIHCIYVMCWLDVQIIFPYFFCMIGHHLSLRYPVLQYWTTYIKIHCVIHKIQYDTVHPISDAFCKLKRSFVKTHYSSIWFWILKLMCKKHYSITHRIFLNTIWHLLYKVNFSKTSITSKWNQYSIERHLSWTFNTQYLEGIMVSKSL